MEEFINENFLGLVMLVSILGLGIAVLLLDKSDAERRWKSGE
jgi:hypothetical protein